MISRIRDKIVVYRCERYARFQREAIDLSCSDLVELFKGLGSIKRFLHRNVYEPIKFKAYKDEIRFRKI